MTLVATPLPAGSPSAREDFDDSLDDVQHIVLEDVSWEFYEHLLQQIGNDHTRVTYDEGRIEIMSPLPKHERLGEEAARLVALLGYERDIDVVPLGSTTFRKQERRKGLEPDKCFYIRNADAGRRMEKAFDPEVDPPPDLAVEVDITRRSIPREPIYAALGVPELWRFDKTRLVVRTLQGEFYIDSATSLSFPFLPMAQFRAYVVRLASEPTNPVLREFGAWVRSL